MIGLKGKGSSGKDMDKNEERKSTRPKRKLLPKVVPHDDKCYLLEFHSDNNDLCEQMKPVLQRLEEDLDTTVRRINVFRRREFMTLLESIGFNECGNLPFYYNRRTGQAVCGPTSYVNLKRWGTGDLNHLFQDPPENQFEQDQEMAGAARRDVGLKGFIGEKIKSLEKKGRARAAKETSKRSTLRQKRKVQQEGTDAGSEEVEEVEEPTAAEERRAARNIARQKKRSAVSN